MKNISEKIIGIAIISIFLVLIFIAGFATGERHMLKKSFSRIDKAYDLGFEQAAKACVDDQI